VSLSICNITQNVTYTLMKFSGCVGSGLEKNVSLFAGNLETRVTENSSSSSSSIWEASSS